MMAASQREKYIDATKELAESLAKVVESVKERFGPEMQLGSSQAYMMVSEGMKGMTLPIWTAYWKWMNDIGATTRQEVEELQKSFGDDKDVLKCTEELHAIEAGFREIIIQLHHDLQKEEDKVVIGRN